MFLVCSSESGQCFLLSCPYWNSFRGSGMQAQCGWSFCSGPHRLQSGVSGAGACSSPHGWQNPELCCRTEALDPWRLPSLFVASRNGFRVFRVVTFVTQCGIQTFHYGVKTSLAAASSAGQGAPLINRMAGAAQVPLPLEWVQGQRRPAILASQHRHSEWPSACTWQELVSEEPAADSLLAT